MKSRRTTNVRCMSLTLDGRTGPVDDACMLPDSAVVGVRSRLHSQALALGAPLLAFEKWRTPSYFCRRQKTYLRYASSLKWPTRPRKSWIPSCGLSGKPLLKSEKWRTRLLKVSFSPLSSEPANSLGRLRPRERSETGGPVVAEADCERFRAS